MKKIVLIAAMLLAFGLSANAQMIGATNNQGTYRPTGNSPEYHPTGSLLNIELGSSNAIAYGYQINPYLRAGIGLGVFADVEYDEAALPLFAEVRVSTPRHKFSMYADFKGGINLPKHGEPRRFFASQLGVSFRYFSIGAGICNFGRYGYDDYYGLNFSFGWNIPVNNMRNKLF